MLRTNVLKGGVVFLALRPWIRTQSVYVMVLGQVVQELLEPNRLICSTFCPKTTCAFAANSDARKFFTCFEGRLAQASDGHQHSNQVGLLGGIR